MEQNKSRSDKDNFTIEDSIIASKLDEKENLSRELVAMDSEAVVKTKSSEIISNISGFGILEQTAKIPPIFDNSEKVTISVDKMSIVDFIHYVFDDLLALNYVISSKVGGNKNKVSLSLTDSVSKEILYSTAKELLEDNDIAMLRKDNIIYFQKKLKDKRYQSASVGIGRTQADIPSSTGEIVQIIPYTYTNSRSLASVVKKLTGIEVKIDAKRKMVMVEGSANDIIEVMRVLQMLDVPSSIGKEIRLIKLAYIAPDSLVEKLKELLENDGYLVGKDNDITFVSVPRLGGVVVYGASKEAVERVELWTEKLDIAVAGNEPRFYIYRPQFNKAVDLQASIGGMISAILNETSHEQNSISPSSNSEVKNVSSSKGVSTSTMSVDPVQNSLIFYTTADKYRKIIQLLEKLDKLPGQVILDIAIAEVTLGDNVSSGIDWFYNSNGESSPGVARGGKEFSAVLNDTGSLILDGINGDWRSAINFIASKSDVRVLAKPFLIVKDGESASINSGDQIPTLTQTSTSDTDRVTNSVQYISTGIQVSVTPTINAKGLINLAVTMSSSSSTPNDELTPTITNRTINTNIFSADGQTVALGGLISEKLVDEDNHVPLLGSIPLLGKAFSSTSNKYSRTELIMLITTKVVKNVNEVDEFKDKVFDLFSFPSSN
ncbi:secretin N-terminal domain-containing protein [Thalassotalea insulae]|uniref:secretin N-terminal domain-containing protein n=1 Tax=Thalassotalea insulae TaxID=2056778 RepID=UPI0024E0FB08|nr:secretin N-terminal domain-containing protein [Thalassotalea insulae]